jgi:branched-chain amino acid transport system permease protein
VRLPGVILLAGALVAALGFPAVAPVYHTTLMLPFMAYAIALLGLNLLFGYTGLVSFGHALFLGLGAYTGAALTSHTQIRSLEAILLVAAVVAGVVAAPVGRCAFATRRSTSACSRSPSACSSTRSS